MENINRFNVVHRFRKRQLLIAINCVAALSIFFFGYDQGMMAGVNNSYDYYTLMGFAHQNTETKDPVITNSILQGGIVSSSFLPACPSFVTDAPRSPFTILAHSSALSSVVGLEISMVVSRLSL